MKAKSVLLIIISLFLLGGTGCEKEIDDNELISTDGYTEGYIVGVDPCTIYHHYRIGYIIVTTDLKDTLLTYNLSDNTYKMPASIICSKSDTLYKIPKSYFQHYPFFSDSLRYKYGIKFSYSVAKENEKIYNLCTDNIVSISYPQVIIKSATKR